MDSPSNSENESYISAMRAMTSFMEVMEAMDIMGKPQAQDLAVDLSAESSGRR